MPNPTDGERSGDASTRSTRLLTSAGNAANTKKSWSEWFGAASNGWLGLELGAHGADQAAGAVSGAAKDALQQSGGNRTGNCFGRHHRFLDGGRCRDGGNGRHRQEAGRQGQRVCSQCGHCCAFRHEPGLFRHRHA